MFTVHSVEDLAKMEALRKELPELEKHNTNANYQIRCYKEDMESLATHPERLMLILDFTKFSQVLRNAHFIQFTVQVKDGHVHDLVAVFFSFDKDSKEIKPKFFDALAYALG